MDIKNKMEKMSELNDASFNGELLALHKLLQTNPLILDDQITGCFTKTSLHISAMRGHVDFTKKILEIQPEMAKERSVPQKSTPLHLASAKGYIEIVKMLLMVNSEMCYASDNSGRNPLHIAAVKGRIDVLKELVHARPLAIRAVVEEGDTILHLCVKYNQVDALKVLVENCIVENNDDAFVNSKNDGSDTILHLAVADKQIEMIKYIINRTKVEVNAMNAKGYTALDILSQSRRDVNDILISESLRLVGGRRARDLSLPSRESQLIVTSESNQNNQLNQTAGAASASGLDGSPKVETLHDQYGNSLMVVGSLIAAMSFQAALNPPGGPWQDNTTGKAGTSIMAFYHRTKYDSFQRNNMISFMGSILVISFGVLLPLTRTTRSFMLFAPSVFIGASVTSSLFAFNISLSVLSSDPNVRQQYLVVALSFILPLIIYMLFRCFFKFALPILRREEGANSNRTSQRAIPQTV